NELFRTQTDYEIEISLSFFRKLLTENFKPYINPNNTVAEHLLLVALILGKYKKMQVRSTSEAIEKLSEGITDESITAMFLHLFAKYENPKILTYNLKYLSIEELDILMFVLQG